MDSQAQPYSVRLPTAMRKQLDEHARQHGRSLHAEILLRLSASLKSELPEDSEYVTRAEVEEMVLLLVRREIEARNSK